MATRSIGGASFFIPDASSPSRSPAPAPVVSKSDGLILELTTVGGKTEQPKSFVAKTASGETLIVELVVGG